MGNREKSWSNMADGKTGPKSNEYKRMAQSSKLHTKAHKPKKIIISIFENEQPEKDVLTKS